MSSVVVVFLESLKMPFIIGPIVFSNLLLFALPGFVLGLVLGWSWKPKFPNLYSSFESSTSTTNSKNSNHTCLLISHVISSLLNQRFISNVAATAADNYSNDEPVVSPINSYDEYCSILPEPGKSVVVTSEDVEHLCQLVEGRDGGRTSNLSTISFFPLFCIFTSGWSLSLSTFSSSTSS
ncbi:hypothetical protein MKX03_002380, partial [Papaver bracteatum]